MTDKPTRLIESREWVCTQPTHQLCKCAPMRTTVSATVEQTGSCDWYWAAYGSHSMSFGSCGGVPPVACAAVPKPASTIDMTQHQRSCMDTAVRRKMLCQQCTARHLAAGRDVMGFGGKSVCWIINRKWCSGERGRSCLLSCHANSSKACTHTTMCTV
jgi:hypothetical protein